MKRITFLVDGFNLYHSIVQAQNDNGGQCVKWLDLNRLCQSHLHLVRRGVKTEVTLHQIHYFSAFPGHCPEGTQRRHQLYMRCLRSSGIHVHLGRFKEKRVNCKLCNGEQLRHEEKETDVAMAAKLFELCYGNEADAIVIMTGDTDLAPAVKLCQHLFHKFFICFAFPYARKNRELKRLAPMSFKITRQSYLSNQFPDPLQLADGKIINRPAEWR